MYEPTGNEGATEENMYHPWGAFIISLKDSPASNCEKVKITQYYKRERDQIKYGREQVDIPKMEARLQELVRLSNAPRSDGEEQSSDDEEEHSGSDY